MQGEERETDRDRDRDRQKHESRQRMTETEKCGDRHTQKNVFLDRETKRDRHKQKDKDEQPCRHTETEPGEVKEEAYPRSMHTCLIVNTKIEAGVGVWVEKGRGVNMGSKMKLKMFINTRLQ